MPAPAHGSSIPALRQRSAPMHGRSTSGLPAFAGRLRYKRGVTDALLLPDPVIEAYKPGVDRTLLLENLRRTPTERLLAMMSMQRLIEEMRRSPRAVAPDRDK